MRGTRDAGAGSAFLLRAQKIGEPRGQGAGGFFPSGEVHVGIDLLREDLVVDAVAQQTVRRVAVGAGMGGVVAGMTIDGSVMFRMFSGLMPPAG